MYMLLVSNSSVSWNRQSSQLPQQASTTADPSEANLAHETVIHRVE
jgi:hypothetical protein